MNVVLCRLKEQMCVSSSVSGGADLMVGLASFIPYHENNKTFPLYALFSFFSDGAILTPFLQNYELVSNKRSIFRLGFAGAVLLI